MAALRYAALAAASGASALRGGACPVASTKKWIVDVVVGMSLCPWAAGAVAHGLRVERCAVADAVPAAVRELAAVAAAERATVALALEGDCDFAAYLAIADAVDGAIDDLGYRGVVQLATFHPAYEFGDAEDGAAGHWTNRSPFPVLHLLREDDVARALAGRDEPDADAAAEAVWRRNVAVVSKVGEAAMRARVAACAVPPPGDSVTR